MPGQDLFHDTEQLPAAHWSAQAVPAREGLHFRMTYAPLLSSAQVPTLSTLPCSTKLTYLFL